MEEEILKNKPEIKESEAEYLERKYKHYELQDDDKYEEPTGNQLKDESQYVIQKSQDDPNEVLPFSIKVIYSLPAFSKMSCVILLNIHAIIFYESLGTSLLYLSFFVALARAIEILLKPLIAHLSDKATFKMGRRKPFMLIGMCFYAFFLIVLFYPPYGSNISFVSTSVWFGIFYVLFFIADTVCNVPYLALGPELSTNSAEREKLYIVFYVFQYMGILFASASPVLIMRIMRSCDCTFCDDTIDVLNKLDCVKKCKLYCNFKSNENSLMSICLFIGLFFIVSIIILSIKIKEKKYSFNKSEVVHFVPSITKLFQNRPFLILLLPWILDTTISTIFGTMLPFYLNYVINPQKICVENNIDLNADECSTNTWIGYIISLFFIVCMISMGIWHFIVKVIGKKKSWQIYSLVSIFTLAVFFIGNENSLQTLLITSVLLAIPAGGTYLNDVFLADIIDYDEFITGKRNEGVYTVFSSFIPKIVSIFAQAIPLAIMAILGFNSSVDGINSEQPVIVVGFIKFYFIGIPMILAFISYYFKLKYPINDKEENMMVEVRNSINLQKLNMFYLLNNYDYYKVKDPVFKTDHTQILLKNQIQRNTKNVVDHFVSDNHRVFLKSGYLENIKQDVLLKLYFIIFGLTFSFIILLITLKYLEYRSLSFIPLMSLFFLSFMIILLVFQIFRLNIIKQVIDGSLEIDLDFMKLIIYLESVQKEINLRGMTPKENSKK